MISDQQFKQDYEPIGKDANGRTIYQARKRIPLGPGDRDAIQLAKEKGVEREVDLHDEILAYCRVKGWLALHGSTACRTSRTIGEPDFIIFASQGRVFAFECKSKTGKLRPEQLAVKMLLETLGHGGKYGIIRSMGEFLTLITETTNPKT